MDKDITFTDTDLKIMLEASKETNVEDEVVVLRGNHSLRHEHQSTTRLIYRNLNCSCDSLKEKK